MFVRPGLGDALEDQIIKYQRALHDIAIAMDTARKSGQAAAADQLRVQFNALTVEVNKLVAQKRGQEMPSQTALDLANFGEQFATQAKTFAILMGIGIVGILVLPALVGRRR